MPVFCCPGGDGAWHESNMICCLVRSWAPYLHPCSSDSTNFLQYSPVWACPVLNCMSRLNVLRFSERNGSDGVVNGGVLFAAWWPDLGLNGVLTHRKVHDSLRSALCCLAMCIVFGVGVTFWDWDCSIEPGLCTEHIYMIDIDWKPTCGRTVLAEVSGSVRSLPRAVANCAY